MSHPLVRSWGFSWSAEGRSPRTMQEMLRFIARFEAFLDEAETPLMTATRGDCEQFISSLPTPSQRAWAWRSLRSFFRFACEELEQTSPMARVKSPKVPLTEVNTATEDDVLKLIRACAPFRTATNARDAAIVATLWASGMRRSELAGLQVADVCFETGSVLIRKAKNGKARRAPLDERALQHLARWLAKRATYPVSGADALWIGKKGPMTSDGIRQVLERRRREAGVTVSCHSMRRGWAAESLGRRGISQASVMVAAGWTTPTMPNLYTRTVAQDLMLTEFHRK